MTQRGTRTERRGLAMWVVAFVVVVLTLVGATGCGGGDSAAKSSGATRQAAGGSYRYTQGDGPEVVVGLRNDTDTQVSVNGGFDAKGWPAPPLVVPARGMLEETFRVSNFDRQISPADDFCGWNTTWCDTFLAWESFQDGRINVYLSASQNSYRISEVTVRREGDQGVIGTGKLRIRVERMWNEAGSGRPQLKLTVING